MKFIITATSAPWLDKKQLDPYMRDKYPCLQKYNYRTTTGYCWGEFYDCPLIEINSIEELVNLGKTVGEIIITDPDDDVPVIEIYDGYRE